MSAQSFETIKVIILGILKKCHLDLAPMESHRVYYRKGVVLPLEGCGPCKACV